MKKLLSLILALLMTAALLPMNLHKAVAEDETSGQCGDDLYWSFNKTTGALTITGSGAMWNYSSSSNPPWASFCSEISEVEIQDGVTSIGSRAFYGCTGLTEITIPDSVTSIGGAAFYGCTGLTEITIPDSVTSIGSSAFSGCTGLQSITIPDGVTSINGYTFYGCTGLTEITIPDSVTSIGEAAFYGCTGLQSITIPDGVTSIGGAAFYGCTGLTSITMPCIASIRYTFSGCTGIMSVHLTKGTGVMTDYDSNTYKYTPWYNSRENAITVTLDDGIQNISNYAFYNCTGLQSITIPDSVTSIGSYAFYNCTSLREITMPCSASIESNAFYNCTGITSVHLTKGTGIMADYYSDKKYTDTPWYNSRGNAITVTLDDGIQNIGNFAFYDCTGLTSITIPDSVESIGGSAFDSCTGLTSITIPDSVTSIGEYAFLGCTGLRSVTIGDSVTTIGESAFEGCTGLQSITIPDGVTSIYSYAFSGCTELMSITIPDGVTSINGYTFYGCTGLTEITIPDGVTSIGEWAFYGCTGLTEITIPDGVISIGVDAFSGCTGLQSITIGNSVTSIDEDAFFGCTGLQSITIPDSVTSIGSCAFYGCTGLQSVTIGNSVTSIGEGAFYYCTGLTDVYYHGTRRMRNNITIEYDNNFLTSAKWHYLTLNTIEWKTLPDKLQYQEGESLDIAGGVFSAYYDYEIVEEETLTADMITGFDNTTAGEQTLTVTFGGKTLTYAVLVSHVPGEPVQENEVAPTCTQTGGYDEVVYCSGCGEELSREHFDTPALGHDLVHHDAQAATCSEIGWEEFYTCTRCDYTTYAELPALGHDLVHHDAQAATCSEIGWEAYDTCSRCDYTTYVDIPALGHDLIHHEAQAPTCTEIGWEAYDTCSRCDYTTYVEIPALGHAPGEPVRENEVAPTYTAEGSYDEVIYCTRCGAELERHTHTVPQLTLECTIEWDSRDVEFKGKTAYVIANGKAQTPRFTVRDADGHVVDPANYDYEYKENTLPGTAYVDVTFKNEYSGTAQGWFKIYLPATKKTTVENVTEGIRITWAPVEGAAGYVIYRRAWSTTTNGWTSFERWWNVTGTSWIDGSDQNHKVYAGTRYQYGVKAYFERRYDPIAGTEIGGNVNDPSGNYNLGIVGPLKTTVRITTRELKSVEAGSKKLTAKWGPSRNFTGYELQYATDANFTKNVRTVVIEQKDNIVSSYTVTGLTSGKTYYVHVRSYHEFEGFTYYGEWSNVLNCKVK